MLWRDTALLNLLKDLIQNRHLLILGFGREGRSTLRRVLEAGGYASLTIADQNRVSTEDPSIL